MAEGYGATIALQAEQLGTGHAVMQAMSHRCGEGSGLILCVIPRFLMTSTLRSIVDLHAASRAAVTVMTAVVREPFGYGRVVRARTASRALLRRKTQQRLRKRSRSEYRDILF